MGVHGLWRLIESSGKQIPLETLENKVLAVDVSIWLHQAIKGFQDSKGAPVPNAHLLGVYHRICKLLYYKIKPVIVFDGGVPVLKKQTIAKRNQLKYKHEDESERLHQQILSALLKHSAINTALLERSPTKPKSSPKKIHSARTNEDDDMYKLPELNSSLNESQSSENNDINSDDEPKYRPRNWVDIDTIDEKSEQFKALSAEVRHDILTDLKESSKMTSWSKLYKLPAESGEFSTYQIKRVLKRRSIQVSLEEAEKEMGGHSLSLADLEALLNEQGIVTTSKQFASSRIASNENARYLLIKDLQKSIQEAKKIEEEKLELQAIQEEQESKRIPISQENYDLIKDGIDFTKKGITTIEEGLQDIQVDDEEEFNESISFITKGLNIMNEGFEILENIKEINQTSQNEKAVEMITNGISALLEHNVNDGSDQVRKGIKICMEIIDAIKAQLNQMKVSEKSEKFKITDVDLSQPSTSSQALSQAPEEVKIESSQTILDRYLENFNDGDFASSDSSSEVEEVPVPKKVKNQTSIAMAKAYITEYTDLTPAEINKVLGLEEKQVNDLNTNDFYFHEMCLNTPRHKKHFERISHKIHKPSFSVTSDEDLGVAPLENIESKKETTAENSNKNDSKEESSEESDDFVEVKNAVPASSDIIDLEEKEFSEDSDDFIEVENQDSLPVKEPTTEKINLQVVINPDMTFEDDLFADVFKSSENETVVQSQESNEAKKLSAQKEIPEAVNLDDITNAPLKVNSDKALDEVPKFDENSSTEKSEEKQVDETENLKPENLNEEKGQETKEGGSEVELLKTPPRTPPKVLETQPSLTKEELSAIQENLEAEHQELLKEKAHEDRMANSISDQMYKEVQDLLELFGVPYIIAPMEAEAQCAYLDLINLTDGTITDDSDIWLFGGRTVYKNFFSHKKNVMEYRIESIQHSFKLSREQLVLLALLVGSDYTLGIQGIGPVTALEILAAFVPVRKSSSPSQDQLIDGLIQFKNWWLSGRVVGPGKASLRNKLKNISLTENFPNYQVITAYLHPEVETSKEKFSWGKPNVKRLHEFGRIKFGWSETKSNEILMPVIKRIQESNIQKTIISFFNKRAPPVNKNTLILSKRVQKALELMEADISKARNTDDEDEEEEVKKEKSVKPARKRKPKTNDQEPSTSKSEPQPKKSKKKRLNEPEVVTVDVSIKPLDKIERKVKPATTIRMEKKQEFIPQREIDKINALKAKLKAIEIYRKSKRGPGFVPKRAKVQRPEKDDAELSESSDEN